MPVRDSNMGRQNKPAKINKLVNMQELANAYNAINKQTKLDTADLKKRKEAIVELLRDPEVGVKNGNHTECTVPKGDGKTNIFVQLQVAESVVMVDTIIPELRELIGEDELKPFITTTTTVSIHPNALEQLYNKGLITALNIDDLTITKETERLIIKEVKIGK